MHELSLALSLLDRVGEECAARGGLRVRAVHLRVGELSGVSIDALSFAYQLACEATPLAGTRLECEPVPAAGWCAGCAALRAPVSLALMQCPVCATPLPLMSQGRELSVAGLEVAP